MQVVSCIFSCLLLVGYVKGDGQGQLQWLFSYPGACHKQFNGSGYLGLYTYETCLYTMSVGADEVVSLYLEFYGPSCSDNNTRSAVSVHDGPDNLAPVLSTFSCGVNTASFVSTNSTLTLYFFLNNNSYSSPYVYISFFASPASSRCGGRLDVRSGILTSPNYPHNYDDNDNCTWEVYVPSGYGIQLYINDFQVLDEPAAAKTRSHNRQCDHDSLTILEEDQTGTSVVTRLCGFLPNNYIITTGNITLQFISDGSGNGRGFSIYLYPYTQDACGGTLGGTNGTFGTSSNNSYSCIWHIKVPEGNAIHINASMCGSDVSNYHHSLGVYDGDSTYAPILTETYFYYSSSCSPLSVKSTGNSVFIRFYGTQITAVYTAVAVDQSFDCDFNGGFCGWRSWSGDVFHWQIMNGYSYGTYDGSPCTGVHMQPLPSNDTQLKSHLLSPILTPFNDTRCFRFNYGLYSSAGLTLRDASGSGDVAVDGALPLLWNHSIANVIDVVDYPWGWAQVSVNISKDVTQVLFETTSNVRSATTEIDNVELNPGACPSPVVCYTTVEADSGVILYDTVNGNMTSSCFWEITASTGKIIQFTPNPNLNYYCLYFYNVENGSFSRMYWSYPYYSAENQLIIRFKNQCGNYPNYFIGNFTAINPKEMFGCGGILNNTSGWIYSPNYPNDYSYNLHCEWQIEAPLNATINIFYYIMDIETSDGCTADSLQVYSGNTTVTDILCGVDVYRSATLTSPVTFLFTSDGQNEGRGFEISYRVLTPCGGTLSGWRGSISSPYNGGDNQNCVWTIDTPPNTIIQLSFLQLSMSYQYKIDIYDGSSPDAPYLGRFSGYIVPPPILSTGNYLYLSYNSPYSYYDSTFNIQYEAMEIQTAAVLQAPGQVSSFDVTPFYANTSFFAWELNATPGLNVKLNFESLRLEDDPLCLNESLIIYDGARSPNTSLGSFCGSRLPPSVRSTSSRLQLFLSLRTNESWKGFVLSFLETPEVPSLKGCGIQHTAGGRDRIVGGTPAMSGKWPWQASLRYNGNHVCGASLISERWLVAAAHCFWNYPDAYEWQVYLGITNLYNSTNAVIANVDQIITHERFNMNTIDYDIALVRLSDAVSFDTHVSPICLPPSTSHFPQPGKTCFISGWGRTSLAVYDLNSDLLEAPMQIFSHEACSSDLIYGNLITTHMICIGHPAGAISSCQGDSGGPLACQGTDKAWYLSGVTSWGYGCAFPMKPAVYTKTSKFLSWIKQYTGLP